jgi:hypothetical protein
VVIGDDVPVWPDDYPGAGCLLLHSPLALVPLKRAASAEKLLKRIVLASLAGGSGGPDVYHLLQ